MHFANGRGILGTVRTDSFAHYYYCSFPEKLAWCPRQWGGGCERPPGTFLTDELPVSVARPIEQFSKRMVRLVETRRVLKLLYSLNAEDSFLGKVHPFRERL
jgi:hypothetical protein